jgi:hypothetical protein
MRSSSKLLATPLLVGCSYALAQGGDLAGVTMRVVDDLRGLDAVVLELEAEPAPEAEEANGAEGPATAEPPAEEADDGSASDDAEPQAEPPA